MRYKTAKYACYFSNASISVAGSITPLLFITFHTQYGISFTLLGLLALINYCTQLCVDLIFSFYSHKFNITKTVRIMPLLTVTGLVLFAALPPLFPSRAYLFIVFGTVIFSAAAGLAEVLISPVIAALPSDNPERDMSRAHSVYAWGVAVVVLISTLFLNVFGREYWYILTILWTVIPLCAFILFINSDIPELDTPESGRGTAKLFKSPAVILCILCIFLGGASENTMAQWCSGYLEAALGIPKLLGDVFGMALFAVMLGFGRSLYAKYGKNISLFLVLGFASTFLCYFTAVFAQNSVIGLLACGLTGFCTSMLWPGTLIYTAEILPSANVAVYALLAAGGDLGSSVAPFLVGKLTDTVAATSASVPLFAALSPEQAGFKCGLLAASLFPLAGIAVAALMKKKDPNPLH